MDLKKLMEILKEIHLLMDLMKVTLKDSWMANHSETRLVNHLGLKKPKDLTKERLL